MTPAEKARSVAIERVRHYAKHLTVEVLALGDEESVSRRLATIRARAYGRQVDVVEEAALEEAASESDLLRVMALTLTVVCEVLAAESMKCPTT